MAGQTLPDRYSAGIYARLSVDSSERKNESIASQIQIAKDFIGRQEDILLAGCYTDVGKTGTDFERPGFERMLRDVRAGEINCIIVKDFSRFGRDHIETGNYIEKIFPFLGIRFISVTDAFDSAKALSGSDTLRMNLKNLVNEMYARDISQKVRSSRRLKREQGGYTGGTPPYGYRSERAGGRICLAVEENSAAVVRKIYELFLSGRKIKEIVEWLYENRIVRPSEYHRTGKICPTSDTLLQWPASSVKMILTNPVYTGCLAQGGTCGKDGRMRPKHDVAPEDWCVKEHTHEPVVSEEAFLQAAEKFENSSACCNQKGYSKTAPIEQDIFAGLLYCGVCGSKMKRITCVKTLGSNDKVRIYGYNCPNYARVDANKCASKYISLPALTGIVKQAVRLEFALSPMRPKELAQAARAQTGRVKNEWDRQLAVLDRKIENITRQTSEYYLEYRMDEISRNAFLELKEENGKKIRSFQKERAQLLEKRKRTDKETLCKIQILRALAKGGEKAELTAEAVRILITGIEVYPDRRIKINFAFRRKDGLV